MTQVAIWPIQKAKLQSRGDERVACDSKLAVVAWMRLDGERSGNSCKGVRLSARPWLEELDCRLSMVDFSSAAVLSTRSSQGNKLMQFRQLMTFRAGHRK
ncbi:MAG: hypothetical protein ABTR54_02925 [Candidatus Competibacter sp.]